MPRFFPTSQLKTLSLIACLIVGTTVLAACSSREQRAQNYYEQGMSYIQKQDFVKASIEFRNALQLKPDMVDAFRGLAQVEEHNNNWQGVAANLRSVAELDPKDYASRIKLIKIYLIGGALDPALKLVNAAIEAEPKSAVALSLKSVILLRLKDNDGAVEAAEKAREVEPDNTDAIAVLAAVKFVKGDPDGALGVLADNVTSEHKNDIGIITLQINIYESMGRLQDVETLLRRLVSLHPDEPTYETQLIRFYVAHHLEDDAVKELRAVTAKDPANIPAELQLVGLLGSVKGIDAARAELVTRISAGGDVFPYQIALARVDFVQGHEAESTSALQKLINSSLPPEQTMAARTTLAELYIAKNNVPAAEPVIADILRVDGHNATGLRLRATIHIDRNQFDDAIGDLRLALNDAPHSPQLLAALGLAYERSGSIELADKAYFDALRGSNFSADYGLNYVSFLRRRGLSDHAEQVLTDLAGRNRDNVAILSTLAEVKLARKDWAGAHDIAETIRRLGGKNEKSDLADQINGLAFGGEKKFNESIATFKNAYDANPDAAQPMAEVVGAYLQAKQFDKATSFLQAALKANPNNAQALVLLGRVQLADKKPDQASKSFQGAINLQPKNPVGYDALARFYVSQNNYDGAMKVIQAGIEQQPKSFALQLYLGGLYELKGDYDAAIAQYDSLLKDQPGSMVLANNVASLLVDHHTDKASLDRANSLATLLKNSEVPEFKDTVGWVAYQRGDYRGAVSLLEAAVAALPDVALVHYHLGMAYEASGQNDRASEQFKSALDLAPNDADLKTKIDAALKTRSEKEKNKG